MALHDPAPLKHHGAPLWVSEPIDETIIDLYSGMTIVSTLEVPLRTLGTLRAVSVPVDWSRDPVNNIGVQLEATTDAPLRAVYSPYHVLQVTRGGAHAATASFSGWSQPTGFDITVALSTGDEALRLDLMPFRYDDQEGGHVMALVTPETDPDDQSVVPRDIAIVLDRSGSMNGEKMSQARTALKQVLSGLRPQDHVALVTFATDATPFHDDAVQATADHVDAAMDFVDTVVADGGTNIHDALKQGLSALPLNQGNPRYVVLLTDGIATEGVVDTDAIVEMVRIQNEVGARIVSFGIGDDVNTVLLEKLANETGGDAIYIRPGFSITDAVASFFEQLQAPMLANPVLDLSDFGGSDFYPETLPDLFAGQTIAVLARYSTSGQGQIALRGLRSGEQEDHSFDVTMPEFATASGFVPRIWATRHIGTLLHRIKLEGVDPVLVDEVTDTARRYGIVTEFTFYSRDEDGNSNMTYSEVPMDSVGDRAVSTSAALDEYEKDDGVRQQSILDARFVRDRVLPFREGWFTDTYPKTSPTWIDVHFGSEAYFALAVEEAAGGIGPFLAVARNVRFEHLGRTFRVTDPIAPPGDVLPAEATNFPAPREIPSDVFTAAEYTEVEIAPIPDVIQDEVVAGVGAGCTAGGTGGGSSPAAWLLFIGFMLVVRRRLA
ncbi:MAG: hypothetical protein ACI9WU_005352 [Myxococcota bacterium]